MLQVLPGTAAMERIDTLRDQGGDDDAEDVLVLVFTTPGCSICDRYKQRVLTPVASEAATSVGVWCIPCDPQHPDGWIEWTTYLPELQRFLFPVTTIVLRRAGLVWDTPVVGYADRQRLAALVRTAIGGALAGVQISHDERRPESPLLPSSAACARSL